MCRKSFNLPGVFGLPSLFQNSLLLPPFQFLVVKPNISTLTEHLSKVLDKISAQIAAIVIGRPLEDVQLQLLRFVLIFYQEPWKDALSKLKY